MNKYILFVNSTYNNTILTLTDAKGNTINWFSSGRSKFKGTKKSTPYSAQISTENILKAIKGEKIKKIDVRIKGAGPGRDSVLRTLNNNKVFIKSINDTTSIPHNGCRPPKIRRT